MDVTELGDSMPDSTTRGICIVYSTMTICTLDCILNIFRWEQILRGHLHFKVDIILVKQILKSTSPSSGRSNIVSATV